MVNHPTADRVDNSGGIGVAVGVDTDDELDLSCQHGHCGFPFVGPMGSAPTWMRSPRGRTVMRHDRMVGQASDQASGSVGQVGAGDRDDISKPKARRGSDGQ